VAVVARGVLVVLMSVAPVARNRRPRERSSASSEGGSWRGAAAT